MGFQEEITRFNLKTGRLLPAVFIGASTEVLNSIKFGSVETGSPGQPIADVNGGNLRGSWQLEFVSNDVAIVSTNSVYAESNEDGIARPGGGPYRLLASVGGRWSVRLTILGFPRIVDSETRRLIGAAA